jgi:prepilin-type N-terminal cleavage/methylation domain-containing protein
MINIMKARRGFTIMELLVSLAIIAVLLSVVLVLMDNVRERTRDSKRVSDMREVSKAFELYAVENGRFPIAVETVTITGEDAVSTALESAETISEMPTDPIHPTTSYTYQTDPQGDTYTISFCLETDNIENYSKGCGNTIEP